MIGFNLLHKSRVTASVSFFLFLEKSTLTSGYEHTSDQYQGHAKIVTGNNYMVQFEGWIVN